MILQKNTAKLQDFNDMNTALQARVDKMEVKLESSKSENLDLQAQIKVQKEMMQLLEREKKSFHGKRCVNYLTFDI